ncbi:DNA ligase/mRNA capping enzyme [Parathielavia hyrcaniae]|uniref:DNA ligase/mRNA capping enzyme n=1 Tax=Parathielavia hyrcaniae TaxID=113614 RepID=A0AAN6PYH4_9PEZI|nr:DNA ligase/mRNA capping enzyme [Parathielavia hyrcaniae]
MSSGKSSAPVQRADLRAWLEAAIASADAALKPKIPSTATSEAETVAESSAASSGHKRKLVTVRRITAVTGIQKDNNMVEIDGWKVVVEKAKGFAKDSYVLFLEMDSFLPAHSPFEDLFCEAGPLVTFDGEDGYRVGTSAWTDWDGNEIVSQGHIFHLLHFRDINQKVCDLHFEHIHQTNEEFAGLLRGIDFTDDLGVKKWESFPETPATNTSEGSMIVEAATSNPKPPSFIIKADMERVQNCPNLFKKPKYQHFVFQESLKMDGSTMAVYFIPNDSPLFSDLPTLPAPDYSNKDTFLRYAVHPTGRLGVCTRQQDLLPHLLPSRTVPAHAHFWAAAVAANIHKLLPALNKPVAVHAELVGATVQGNPYAYPAGQHELFVFSISDLNPPPSPTGPNNGAIITASRRWHPRRVEQFAADKGLKHVPVLGYHTIPSVARHHQDLVDRAELKKGEGLVFKNCADGRWFKVLSSRWIREKGDEMHARKQAAAAKKGGGKGHDDVDGEARAGGKDGDGREALGWTGFSGMMG